MLIDEAQDTNPVQWEVVERLTGEFFAGLGARDVARTVFAVGDAKQSIFSFQGADPAAFHAMRERYRAIVPAAERAWREVSLTVSFRSTPAVLAAVDAVFAADPGRAGVALDGEPIVHTASRGGDAGLVELWPPIAVAEAGAFAVVMEMVPAELATQITGKLTIPTIGIGAGRNCDAQVLVWQDMAGLTSGKTAKFVKRFGDVGGELRRAATQYADEVAGGVFPGEEHSF